MRHPIQLQLPRGILGVFSTIFYENEFQNPQIFQQTIRLFPEHSTLYSNCTNNNNNNNNNKVK
jgi:hypothetical protein